MTRTALVTGASRGVGKGVATALSDAGFQVFATGRSIAQAALPSAVVRLTCDHTNDAETAAAFDRLAHEVGHLDLLVNCAWGGYERMVDNGAFTWTVPFWQQPAHRWSSMMDAGVRAAFIASQHAARLMVPAKSGLIVNISFWPAQKYVGNLLYGVSKAATDKMTADMAHELRPHGVSTISLYPGLVRTESVMEAAAGGWLDLSNSESPEFIGRVIAALAADQSVLARSGTVVVAAAAARELNVEDVDGRRPVPLTLESVWFTLSLSRFDDHWTPADARELLEQSAGVRRHAAAAAADTTETAVTLADDERRRALRRATAALKAVKTETTVSSDVSAASWSTD